jgi:hypothetical protein
MSMPKTRGRCAHCDKDCANAGMGAHLARCLGPGPALHVAFDVGPGTWWLHLALAPSVTMGDLDGFLRRTWLDCCGHMSAFEVGGTRYEVAAEGGFGWGPKPRSMSTKAAAAVPPGTTFTHEYDYGSTTVLRGRSLGLVAAGTAKITILAQNEPVVWPCDTCAAPGERICAYCHAVACKACGRPCTCVDSWEDESSRVVDSPRMGVCAYGT